MSNKPTASEWKKFCKNVHSLSDVITVGYHINGYPEPEDCDSVDSEPLHIAKVSDHVLDALRYAFGTPTGTRIARGVDFGQKISTPYPEHVVEKTCTCGAHKTYGPKCGKSSHSNWCDLVN